MPNFTWNYNEHTGNLFTRVENPLATVKIIQFGPQYRAFKDDKVIAYKDGPVEMLLKEVDHMLRLDGHVSPES